MWWQALPSALKDKIIYLNALECQISQYRTSIAPNFLAGKWTLVLPHPKPWFPPSFFFLLSPLLLYAAYPDWLKDLVGSGKSSQKNFPPFSDLFKHYMYAFWHYNKRKDRKAHRRLYLLDGTMFKGVSRAQSIAKAWWQLLFGGIWLLLELILPLAFLLLRLFVVAGPSVCYVMFRKELKVQCVRFFFLVWPGCRKSNRELRSQNIKLERTLSVILNITMELKE